ncbi:MAG: response regulator [Leptospiraceae bacterium]|nr:response regulator [Leptospiraceae bacterium]MDW7975795.1 response regulator [Leptospiraceae bacterium]
MAHILAVDDSQTMRDLVKETLESVGYQVTVAENGLDGLEKFKKNKYDLVIADINMPVMDGITMIKEIRKIDKFIPIITLTTESEETKKQEGRAAGADGWIVKPFKPAQFLDIIKQILEG